MCAIPKLQHTMSICGSCVLTASQSNTAFIAMVSTYTVQWLALTWLHRAQQHHNPFANLCYLNHSRPYPTATMLCSAVPFVSLAMYVSVRIATTSAFGGADIEW